MGVCGWQFGHGRVRGVDDPPVVDRGGRGGVSRGHHVVGHRRLRRIEQLPGRLWKRELATFAKDADLDVVVCHFPPGTSKWNKIEHRLFSHISMNWRGRVLESREVVVNLIAGTTNRTGLTVRAELDHGVYQKGIKVTDREMKQLPLVRHEFHGDWNYTMKKSMEELEQESE